MSYFTEGETKPNETTKQEDTSTEDYLGKVVAEKGEQWSDPGVLAKGYVSAQEYIKHLEEQTSELRTDLEKQDYAKTLLEQLQSQGKPTTGEGGEEKNGGTGEENTTPKFSEDELKSLIKSTLSETTAEERKLSNLQKVDEQLSKMFGTNVKEHMDKRSKELGLSKERMQEIASESPDAFFSLMGEAPKKESNDTPDSSVNTASLNTNTDERNWSWWQELRRKNPQLYRSVPYQKMMLEDKKRLGDKFGN